MTEKVLLPAAAAKPQSPIKLVTLHRCWALAIICWVEYWTSLVFSFCPPSWFYPWFWDQFLMGLSWTWKIGFLSFFFFGSFNGERHFCGHYISFENVDFVLLKSHVCFVYICHCFLLYEPLLHFASHTLFRSCSFFWLLLAVFITSFCNPLDLWY